MPKGIYIEAPERTALQEEVRSRYEAGESIREIAGQIGWSYTVTRRLAQEAGVTFRRPGRQVRL